MDLWIVTIVLLGGVVGLDVVSFPQAMISRPIVAATLGGTLAGSPSAGVLTGVLLELLALETLPVGASRYPEWGSASVAGGAIAAMSIEGGAGAIVIAVVIATFTAWGGGWSMHALRRLNGQWARTALPALAAGDRRALIGLHLRGLCADLVRAIGLTSLALVAGMLVMRLALPHWELDTRATLPIAAGFAVAVAGAAIWTLVHTTSGARWLFFGGAAAGVGLTLVLR